jgi:hypothetical protein
MQPIMPTSSDGYAPASAVAFTPKGSPNAVRFTVSLLEIEFWLKSVLTNGGTSLTNEYGAYYGDGLGPYMSGS